MESGNVVGLFNCGMDSLGNEGKLLSSLLFWKCQALAVFAISDADAQMIKPLYESSFRSKSNGLLGSLESDIYSLAHSKSLLGLLESNSMPRSDNLESHQGMSPTLFKGLNPMVFYYLSKTPGAKPKRLLAPLFQEIRITEVEWSIVESMRTGWIFNL